MRERYLTRRIVLFSTLTALVLTLTTVAVALAARNGPASLADKFLVEASRLGLVNFDDLPKRPSREAARELQQARSQEAESDVQAAIDAYRNVITRYPRSLESVDTRLDLGRAYLAAGQPQEAVKILEQYQMLRVKHSAPEDTAAQAENLAVSGFLLGVAYRDSGDIDRGLAELEKYRARQTPAEPYVRLEMARALLTARRFAEAKDLLAPVLQTQLPSSAAVQARTSSAEASRGLGDVAAAASLYEEAASQAPNAQQQADLSFQAAENYRDAGRAADAQRLFLVLVTDYPRLSISEQALQQMDAMGAPVNDYHRGVVYYWRDQNDQAASVLDRFLAANPDSDLAPQAFYHRALAYRDHGDRTLAVDSLREMTRLYPQDPASADALWQAGQLLEGLDRLDAAISSYAQLAKTFPASDRAETAIFREGFLQYRTKHYDEAAKTWDALAGSASSPSMKARALMWSGKSLEASGQGDQAQQRLRDAANVDGWDYYMLRAQSLMDNVGTPSTGYRSARLDGLSGQDMAEAASWLDTWIPDKRGDWTALDPSVRGELSFRRGEELMQLGLRDYAYGAFGQVGEFNRLLDGHNDDGAVLYQLSLYFRDRGIYYLSINAAYRLLQTSPVTSLKTAPVFLLKLLYPTYYAQHVDDDARTFGVDPLLVLSLIRQESAFHASAGSSAGAIGLTQVIPSTGEGIARALGIQGFQPEALRQPALSVEFGTWYLADQLRTYRGNPLLALAAYNGGGTNVDRWLQGNPSQDPDLFVESITFSETQSYVRILLQNLAMYARLYRP